MDSLKLNMLASPIKKHCANINSVLGSIQAATHLRRSQIHIKDHRDTWGPAFSSAGYRLGQTKGPSPTAAHIRRAAKHNL
jgi:hypothetical protein